MGSLPYRAGALALLGRVTAARFELADPLDGRSRSCLRSCVARGRGLVRTRVQSVLTPTQKFLEVNPNSTELDLTICGTREVFR